MESSTRGANGVRDNGSQAGVDEGDQSGRGVVLPLIRSVGIHS